MHVGIDLGTTFSLIARVDAHGISGSVPDRHEAERFKTPSVVHIGPEVRWSARPLRSCWMTHPTCPWPGSSS